MEGQDRGRQTWKRASSPGRRTAVARRARPMRAARTAPGTATRPRSCAEIWESSRSWEGPLGGSEEQDLGSAPRGAELSYAPASASELRSFGDKAQLLCFHRRHSKLPASHTARPQGTSNVPVLTAAKQKQDAPQTCSPNVFTPASLALRSAGASEPYFDTNIGSSVRSSNFQPTQPLLAAPRELTQTLSWVPWHPEGLGAHHDNTRARDVGDQRHQTHPSPSGRTEQKALVHDGLHGSVSHW